MPRTKKVTKRKYARKRKYTRKPMRVQNSVLLSVGGPGLPQHASIKWALESQATLGAGAAAAGYTQFQANTAYDFYGSGGNEQPPTYDLFQNANAWLRHRILGIKTKFSFINLGTKATRVGIYVSDQVLDMSSLTAYQMQNDRILASTILTPSGGSRDMATLSRYWSFPKLFGKKVNTDDEYKCPYNSVSGLDIIYLYVFAQTIDASAVCNVIYTQNTTQYARLEELSPVQNHTPDTHA